ncbi:MAG TPA: metallophosphoesterase [Bacteroidales bacterium]|nr:metallophosphoesterase [Bacteroidales bacterium]
MKSSQLIIFLAVVFTVYFGGNAYIFFKGYNAIPAIRENRWLYTILFITLAITFIIAKVLESRHSTVFSDVLNIIGGFWMAFLVYGFFFFILSDLISLLLRIPGIINTTNIADFRKWSFVTVVSVSIVLIAGGFINAIIPKVREYNITIPKVTDGIQRLRVAAVSDIHLGSIIRKRSMNKLSEILEQQKPDVIFLLGDIIDGEMGPVLRGDLLQYLKVPVTNDGLFAITGNHEFIGGAKKTIPYIESKGIRVLKDELVLLPGGIQVAGRTDRDSKRFYSKERKPLEELLETTDRRYPVIVLDHQPVNIDEAVRNNVDLQLSGHTHNGQFWPLNYFTRAIYEVSYGYKKIGNTQIIVSSGFGIWGPRIRSASRSEILVINISFEGSI